MQVLVVIAFRYRRNKASFMRCISKDNEKATKLEEFFFWFSFWMRLHSLHFHTKKEGRRSSRRLLDFFFFVTWGGGEYLLCGNYIADVGAYPPQYCAFIELFCFRFLFFSFTISICTRGGCE